MHGYAILLYDMLVSIQAISTDRNGVLKDTRCIGTHNLCMQLHFHQCMVWHCLDELF